MFKPSINPVPYLATLKLSFTAMLALLFGVLFSYFDQSQSVLWIALPLLVLAVNLLAAMIYIIESHGKDTLQSRRAENTSVYARQQHPCC